jgi:AraC family transcriptional regulator
MAPQFLFVATSKHSRFISQARFLSSSRTKQASRVLMTSQPAAGEGAIACGIADQSHFTRVFAGIVGTTPGS